MTNFKLEHILDTGDYIEVGDSIIYRIIYTNMNELFDLADLTDEERSELSNLGGYMCPNSSIEGSYVQDQCYIINSEVNDSQVLSGSVIQNSKLNECTITMASLRYVDLTEVTTNVDLTLMSAYDDELIDMSEVVFQ